MGKHWVEKTFEKCGAIRKGHFALTSERHSGEYLDKALVFPYTRGIYDICGEMAKEVYLGDINVEAVAGPAYGGIIISHRVAYCLGNLSRGAVLPVFTEKDGRGRQILKRGYGKLIADKRVLIVDDILTTGGSLKQVIRAVEDWGGIVVAAAVICNRGGVAAKDIGGYPLYSLWDKEIESWKPENCPLCKANIPLEDPKSC